MSDSTRPSMQSVQRTLIVGVLAGLIFGCAIGAGLVGLYIWNDPPVYENGAYPNELTNAYQNHYLAMVIDSYLVNGDAEVARNRFEKFDPKVQVLVLGEQSAAYMAAGRVEESQKINELARSLKTASGWDEAVVEQAIRELFAQNQSDAARSQAIGPFSNALLNRVPQVDTSGQAAGEPTPAPAGAVPAPAQQEGGGSNAMLYIACCFVALAILLIVYLVGRRRFEARKAPTRAKIEWEGEGTPPLKQWTGTYNLGDDLYDEFFTIETDSGDFLGESGMGIMDAIPNTSPKQVMSFDVGLFDKTDITTISRVVMSEHAYHDETIRAKVEANPQAEAILAEQGRQFMFETSALRVECKIEDLEYGGEDSVYFQKLTLSMNLFLKEGADLRVGEMDVPDAYKE